MNPAAQAPEPRKIFRLSAVTARLTAILLPVTSRQFWVQAQFIPDRSKPSGGHCYGNLVEVTDDGETVAKIRAVIWRSDMDRIQKTLCDRGSADALLGGREICALCAVRFHEVHGLTLTIFEVDPDFGESHIERNRRVILGRLKHDGLLDRNKTVTLSAAPLRIGLVTALDSAALADFRQTLAGSIYSFRILLASAVMQGDGVSSSVVAAIGGLCDAKVDLICIVRGGGSPLDLAWLDDETVARAIATCPIPVWVGIGHEIDFGVLDFIAHTSHKTPTAVAEALVNRIRSLDDRLAQARERLRDACERRAELATQRVLQMANGFFQGTRKHVQIHSERFAGRIARLESTLSTRAADHEARFRQSVTMLQERTRSIVASRFIALQRSQDSLFSRAPGPVKAGQSALAKSEVGLAEGTRKHQAWFRERFDRRAERLRHIVESKVDLKLNDLEMAWMRLRESVEGALDDKADRLVQTRAEVALLARKDLAALADELDWQIERLAIGCRSIERFDQSLGFRVARLQPQYFQRIIDQAKSSLAEKGKRLDALSPDRQLARGYSMTRDAAGRLIRSIGEVTPNQTIHTVLQDGTLISVVASVEAKPE